MVRRESTKKELILDVCPQPSICSESAAVTLVSLLGEDSRGSRVMRLVHYRGLRVLPPGGTKWESLILFSHKETEIETGARKVINIIFDFNKYKY